MFAILLRSRESNLQGLGAVDTKLLYTLHWILLDAAEECRDADLEHGIINSSPFHYLFPITSIQARLRETGGSVSGSRWLRLGVPMEMSSSSIQSWAAVNVRS